MKRVLTVMLIACVMMFSGCKKADNTAVIMVGENAITKQEINDVVTKQLSSPLLAQIDRKSKDYKIMELAATDKAINELIIKKILFDEIAKRNITVSQEDIAAYKENLIKEVGGEENLKQVLAKNNLDETEFNSLLENDIQMSKLIASISPITVSEAEIKKFYNENKASKFTYPDTVKASHILVKDKAKAEEVLKLAKAEKADFAALAKQYSEDPGSAQNGGDLGFFTKDQMVEPFAKAAFSMKPDTVSDLVQTEFGYHIIKVTDRKKAGITPYDEVKNTLKKYLEDEKKIEILQKFIESKKAQVEIKYLDASYSPDGIKKTLQELRADEPVAPQPTSLPAPKDEAK
ncbi:MAG: peptidylprolyl isomerase [bacterium]|nr:peptidylprolyl isomerase [bacterium]